MMNAQRLDVAVSGVGLAEVAGQRARAYARERRQGRSAGGQGGAEPILCHGDVRRMLLTQMALAQGIRALVTHALVELELGRNMPLVEFLTPVAKAFSSDAAVEAAQLAIQVHGGYGYLREYRVEQILRDARVTQIYEGTNGIQGMTLAGRILRLDNGVCARAFQEYLILAANEAAANGLPDWASDLKTGLGHWQTAAEAVVRQDDVGCTAQPFLRLSGLLAFAAAWSRLQAAAAFAPNPGRLTAVAEFARRWMLPETAHLAALCQSGFAADTSAVFDVFG
jgi:hypothetical protein